MADDVVFIFDKDSEQAGEFAVSVFNSLRQWLAVSVREPRPGDRNSFDTKPPNTAVIITPGVFKNEQAKEGLEMAVNSKRNIVFLHHIRSNSELDVEVTQFWQEQQVEADAGSDDDKKKLMKDIVKNNEKAFKENRILVYADDICDDCNSLLLEKLTLKDAASQKEAANKRVAELNMNIMKNSAKISKACHSGTKKKYDLCITAASVAVSPSGMEVLAEIYETMTMLAPALTIGRNTGEKVSSANVSHSFNLIVVLTKDSLTDPELLEDIKTSLDNEGNILLVHHLISCPDIAAEFSKCEDPVITSCLKRSMRFTYLPFARVGVVAGILQPGIVKTDDTKSPTMNRVGKMPRYRLDYKNNFSLDLAGDGTGMVYQSKFNDKKQDLPADIDKAINELFDLYAVSLKDKENPTINWAQFAEIDRTVTECLGGQYNEMISRRAFSMMNYPGLTLESQISKTTFKNYHSFVAKQMGAMQGDKEASVHYKYIVEKVKAVRKGKRFTLKDFDLFVTHDRSKFATSFAGQLKQSIDKHTPNIRTVICTDKPDGREKQTTEELASSSHNVLVLLSEGCFEKKELKDELLAAFQHGAQVMVMCNMENCPMLEIEIAKGDADVQGAMARPDVIEYWSNCDAACCIRLLELMQFGPVDNNTKRPLPNKEVTFRRRDNAAVLYCYQKCEEDTEAASALQALANVVCPLSKSASRFREDFLRDGGVEILKERFAQYQSNGPAGECACRSVASLAQYTPAAKRMAELGVIKTVMEVINLHTDNAALNGEACRAIVNLAQDETAKKVINELGGFQLMLQSQKRFEFNPVFWQMRWGMKEMHEGEEVMVNYQGKGRWCSAKVVAVNKGNGTYDVAYAHGGMDRRLPAQWIRPKDKSVEKNPDQIEEFVGVWQWKPNGKLTEDELILKPDNLGAGCSFSMKSSPQGSSAGTWTTARPKDGGRTLVSIGFTGDASIEMERISMTTLRAINGPCRAVLKDVHDDCIHACYFAYDEGVLKTKPPPLLGRKPDVSRPEQQILWAQQEAPWTGLPESMATNFATSWKGILEITKMGDYTIGLEADTGAKLWINDFFCGEVAEGGEGTMEAMRHLLAGPSSLRVDYFSKSKATKCITLRYSGPDTGDEMQNVPVSVLQHNKEECERVPKPGFLAEYFCFDYSDVGEIMEGIEPDIVRLEKQLDFEASEGAWQGLPDRFGNGFTARYTSYINVTCGDAKKAKYTFRLASGKCGKLFLNDQLLMSDDEPKEIELKKGQHLVRVEYFCAQGKSHELKLFYNGPETGFKEIEQPEGDPIKEPIEILVPPTTTATYILPTFAIPKGNPLANQNPVLAILWPKNDMRFASVQQGGKVNMWEPTSGKALGDALTLGSKVTASCMGSKSNAAFALDSADGTCPIAIYDLEKNVEVKNLVHIAAELPPQEPTEEEANEEGEEGVEKEPVEEPVGGHKGKINCVSFSIDGSRLASCSEDGILMLWDVDAGKDLKSWPIKAPKTGDPIPIWACAFNRDGTRLISGGKEKCMRIWVPENLDCLRGEDKLITPPADKPEHLGEEDEWPPPKEEWDTEPGDPILLEGHGNFVTCIAFSPKSTNVFASTSTDATIRIWELESDEHSASLKKMIDPIQCLSSFVSWSPDAATLVASTEDIYVQVLSAVTGNLRAEPLKGHSASVKGCAWAPHGQCFATCSDDAEVRMWHFLINRNITEIAELEGQQMVFADDMRQWQDKLIEIRTEFKDYKKGLSAYKPDIEKLNAALTEGKERTKSFTDRENLLGLDVTDYFELDGMIDDYSPYYKLWHMVIQFQQSEIQWTNIPVSQHSSIEIENLLDQWYKDVFKMIKAFDNDNMRGIHKIARDLKYGIEDFRVRFPFLKCFANDSLLDRHWDELFKRMKIDRMAEYKDITLRMMLDANILEFTSDFEELSTAAAKENSLRKGMASMKLEWEPLVFQTGLRNGVPLLKGFDEIQVYLDDHVTKTQAIRSNVFCKPFEGEVHKWEATLLYIQDFVDQTSALQRSWMALEPIFAADDIRTALPHESANFTKIDQTFRGRMKQVEEIKNCIEISKLENIVEDMTECNTTIEQVQKGLKDYLETKRLFFPRFFFLNDADLLSILAETKDPTLVQPHMGKAFEGIAKVRFDDSNSIIEAMISAEGESVDFKVNVDVNKPGNKGAVEKWLVEVETTMMDSLRAITFASNQAYADASKKREQWCCEWPGQVVICTDCIYWTAEVEEALKADQIGAYEKKLRMQLSDIVNLVRGELTKLNRTTIGAMVTIDVHARDVVTELVEAKVNSPEDFAWLAQLRYYWQNEGDFVRNDTQKKNTKKECKVCIVNSTLLYGFEYLGNTARLVITPLTDRCYRTLMGAFALYYGGAPEGPAGTGKTESTKDLAKALAIQCVVFNCSDSMDYLQLAKFFKGLASSGSWCCFDEFNRISLEVLSVVAQQIQQISFAIKRRVTTFVFEDTEIRLITTCAVNITMNPGYAGRSELPDNLKALFRPCAMMVPNYALIAEIRLYSFGYEDAKRIGTKATMALKLASEQLSPQKHYDFGMRGLNALLVAGGNGKRNMGDKYPEDTIALRSFMDVNMPKFTTDDIPLFKGIMGDLFPGVEMPESNMGSLIEEMGKVATKNGLIACSPFIQKTVQLWETVLVRHGLMTVGIPPCGKTNVKNTLAETLGNLSGGANEDYMPVTQYVMNPKSITQGQLYGESDINTQEWTDGVLAIAVRSAATAFGDGKRQWVVLDGPVDAIWIENMNTVLDDNKKLCLNSGEIIKLSMVTTMLFEVRDLEFASPATVSRVGIVFLEPENDLGWKPMVEAWLLTLPQYIIDAGHHTQIHSLFESHFEVMLECVDHMRTPFPVSQGWLCSMACRLLESLINDQQEKFCKETIEIPEGEEPGEDADLGQSFNDREVMIVQLFWFTMVWTVGASTDADGRQFCCDVIRGMMENKKDFLKKHDFVADFSKVDFVGTGALPNAPRKDLLHDFYLDPEDGGKWKKWVERIDNVSFSKEAQYHSIVVPTSDTVRNQFMIRTLIERGFNILFSGSTGTAKTASVSGMLLNGFSPSEYSTISFAFSAQTTANQTQDVIDGKLDKRKKGTFGPPPGKKMLVFIDDLNMPFKEEYGAQPPIEILRQMFILTPFGYGWYDRKGTAVLWEFRQLIDTHMLAAMCPPGAGKNDITDRYSRWFNLVYVLPFDEESLARIFSTLVGHFFSLMTGQVQGNAPNAVTATLEIYAIVLKELLPTPAKSHYTFNMRDVSKVFQGLCQCTPQSLPKLEDLVKCWMHESERIFKDRLTTKQDMNWFSMKCKAMMGKHFKKEYDQTVKIEPIIFVDFADPKSTSYMEVQDHAKLGEKVTECLEDYNSMSKIRMDLVLFTSFIQHICRVVRVLKLPLGNALLVGVGGSGRKSTTTLATYVATFELFQIEMSKGYGLTEWHDDMKKVLMRSGCDNMNMVFLFSDTQIAKEAFLEEVSSILNTGEVPNLYASEDKLEITERCSKGANSAGKQGPAEIFAWYVEQCRKNLHIVICMSPIGAVFRNRLRSFPSLVNCCTIDWFHEWPADALSAVANQFLSKDKDLELAEDIQTNVVKIMVSAQTTVFELTERFFTELKRVFYVTPTSYLELINSFISTLKSRRQIVQKAKWRYDTGLEKIADAREQVAALQLELTELEPFLEKAAQETGAMKLKVEKEQTAAMEKKVIVEAEEEKANTQKAKAGIIKADCEKDLAAAMPAYESAVEALSKLSKGDVGEVRGMKSPPPGVILTAQAMCIMFEVKPMKKTAADGKTKENDWWESSKKELLSDPRLLNNMIDFDKDNIPDNVIKEITPLYENPAFDPDAIKKSSTAAMGICKWVRAMVVYSAVAKEVGPKKRSLEQAEREVAEAEETVAVKQAELKEVMDMVADLEAKLQKANDDAKELQRKQKDCAAKLKRAETLLDGLGDEAGTWSKKSGELDKDYKNLTGDILIASGILAYLGVFTGSFRNDAITRWLGQLGDLKIPASKEFSLSTCIGDQVKIRQWIIDCLPNDSLSIDNAIILDNSRRWPLMIDPQMQANKWIKKSEANLSIVRLSMKYIPIMENSIQFGNPILIENIEETLDAILDPVLQKATFKQGTLEMIRLGDSTIEWSKDFKLYITTKLPNPHFPPEICVAVGILNFMATLDGLQDQMLNILVAKEEPETEKKRVTLVIESAQAKAQLKKLEDEILALLSSSSGDILSDETLINTLASSKTTGLKIEEQVKQQDITKEQIQQVRAVYMDLALKSAALYFVVGDLNIVDPMYQFSLDWFIKMFNLAIDRAERKDTKEEQFIELFRSFISLLFLMVSRSLFAKDQLLYAVMLTLKCQEMSKELKLTEVMALLTGLPGHAKEEKPKDSTWLTHVSWARVNALQGLGDVFDGFVGEFSANLAGWKAVFDCDDVDQAEWPNNFKLKCSPMQKALLIYALRADGTVKALQDIVEDKLGRFFLEPPPLNLEECFKDSTPAIPLIYILAMGSDPMADITRLAEGMDMLSKIIPISLGQGQGPKAKHGISEGGKNGEWVLLQNCHLAPSFMLTLESIVEKLAEQQENEDESKRLNPEFRLWLTACPAPTFPISILQNGIKMTIEPPKGLRQAMLRSYLSIDPEFFEPKSADGEKEFKKVAELKKMCFGLCFFHGLILERRGFGPVGWNNAYGFSEPDRDISRMQLKAFLEDFEGVPYEALNYMVAEANYGGRVTDNQDRRAIVCILKGFYTPLILKDDYVFSPSGIYHCPPSSADMDATLAHIKNFPLNTTPEVFWLHNNAKLTAAINEGLYILKTCTGLMSSFGGGAVADDDDEGGKQKTPEEIYSEISADIANRTPDPYDIGAVIRHYPVQYEQCLNVVLHMELGKFNRLNKAIKSTCVNLGKAVKGLVVFSPELEAVGNGCLTNVTPGPWMKASYPSLKPLGSYFDDFLGRLAFMQKWVSEGIPYVFWFSAYFFQQAFITGVLQNFARRDKIAIDCCTWNYEVMKRDFVPIEYPEKGAYTNGLFMAGARWDDENMVIEDSYPKVLWDDMSPIWLKPVDKAKDASCPEKCYQCPVYKTSERKGVLSTSGHSSNFILWLEIPAHIPEAVRDKAQGTSFEDFWTKRGVALISQTDD